MMGLALPLGGLDLRTCYTPCCLSPLQGCLPEKEPVASRQSGDVGSTSALCHPEISPRLLFSVVQDVGQEGGWEGAFSHVVLPTPATSFVREHARVHIHLSAVWGFQRTWVRPCVVAAKPCPSELCRGECRWSLRSSPQPPSSQASHGQKR